MFSWRKVGMAMVSAAVMLSVVAIPVSAASMTEDFETYSSSDDLSLNWIGDGSFITDLTLSKTGGVKGSKGLKIDMTMDKSLPKHWAIVRAIYPDMTSKTATGFRFWGKSDKPGAQMIIHMRYNNMTWKYGTTVTLTTQGKYYDIPFSDMKLTQGTVTADPSRAQDPTLIGEWQFELSNKWDFDGAITLYLDDMRYIEPGQAGTTTTKASTTTTKQNTVSTSTQPGDTTTAPSNEDSSSATDVTEPDDTNATSGSDVNTGTSTIGSDVDNTGTDEDKGGLSGGAIAGIIAAIVVVLGGAGAAVYFLVIKKK